MNNIIMTVLFLGAAQGIVLSVVLLTLRHGHRTANRILACILMLFSINMILHTLSHTKYFFNIPHHSGLITLLFFPFGPLFYFYVKALTSRPGQFPFGKKEFLHFLPFGICTILFVPFYLQSLHSDKPPFMQPILSGLVIMHVLIYIFVVIKRLRDHSGNIKTSFSSLEKINLKWLRSLVTGVVIFWLVVLFLEGLGVKAGPWNFIWVLVSIFMYSIGYLGMRQPEIFSGTTVVEELPKKKYEKSTLTPGKAEEYLRRLLEMMSTNKPFLENDLTLPGLAKKLSITPHELSQIINEQLNRNFFEFVNSYRVEEAQKMITDPGNENLKIAAIGFNVGFNSTSAFNVAFKKHTGLTPSQSRKKISNLIS
jgi:AraC-like DNA-binding protein